MLLVVGILKPKCQIAIEQAECLIFLSKSIQSTIASRCESIQACKQASLQYRVLACEVADRAREMCNLLALCLISACQSELAR